MTISLFVSAALLSIYFFADKEYGKLGIAMIVAFFAAVAYLLDVSP